MKRVIQSFALLPTGQDDICDLEILFAACHYSCSNCDTAELLCEEGVHTLEECLSFIDEKRERVRGVVISGGEPTLFKDLGDFCHRIAQQNLPIHLVTCGVEPKTVKKLCQKHLLAGVSLKKCAAGENGPADHTGRFYETLKTLRRHKVPYEVLS